MKPETARRGIMFASWSRLFRNLAFPAAVVMGLLAFARVALPFAVNPGPLALNYVENSPRISSAGMPTRSQFEEIAKAGFGVVVNLAPPDALGGHDDEQALVERQGMRYFNVPVDFSAPDKEAFARFAKILRDNGEERVLVHCQLGMRASTFVFLYRVTELGEDPEQAIQDVLRVWKPTPQWGRFVREILAGREQLLPRMPGSFQGPRQGVVAP
jgi:protein tyrosine phosphatase (PTP) superfamily phosphohydrolase (DUF442 family)